MDFLSKQLNRLSIKMTMFVLSVVVIVFAISGYVELRMAYDTTVEDAHRRAEEAISTAANAVNHRLYNLETTTHTAGEYADMLEDSPESAFTFLRKIIDCNPDIASTGLFFRPGYYPQHPGLFAPNVYRERVTEIIHQVDISEEQYGYDYLDGDENWEGALRDECVWSEPYVDSSVSGRPMVTFSVPVYDSHQEFMAVLYAEIDLQWLWLLLNELKPTPESLVSAIDSQGIFLCHPDSSFVLSTNALELAKYCDDTTVLNITRRMLRGERGKDTLENGARAAASKGNSVLKDEIEASFVYFAPIERTRWSITYTYPSRKVLTVPKAMFHNMLKIGGLTLLLLLVAITLGIHFIARPFAERLQAATASKASIESELRIASRIQMGMIPKEYPAFPDRPELDVYGMLKPAKSVGGDLYDYFIRDDKFFFCIGDVSGKGVPASLFMAVVMALFRNITMHVADPALIMRALNNVLSQNNALNMFCTMLIGVIDLKTGHMDYCNGGHNAPIIRRVKDTVDDVDVHYAHMDVNIAVGVLDGYPYEKGETVLKPGEAIFLYTDGVTEAENVNKELFGEEATLATLNEARHQHLRSAKDFVDFMYTALQKHAEGTEQSDDITMLVVEYKGAKA